MNMTRRLKTNLRTRSKSCRTGHLLSLSFVCVFWYVLISKRERKEDLTGKEAKIDDAYHREHEIIEASARYKERIAQTSEQTQRKYRPNVDGNQKNVSQENENYPKPDNKIVSIKSELGETPGPREKPQLAWESPPVSKPPIILVWKAMEYQMRRSQELLEFYTPLECGGCQVTTNRALVGKCAALVHFNSPELRKEMDVPDAKYRNPNQIYAFWSRETPAKTHHFSDIIKESRMDSIFNMTINFRLDSDIIDYFGNLEYELRVSGEKQQNKRFEKMLSRKNGLAVWAVSNCNSTYGAAERMKYAKKLMRSGLKITTYGECFGNRNSGIEFAQELSRHKFYISFENSLHCPDYVSEKFWRNGLRAGSVPVVWGPVREDIVKIAPPHSYIHTEDFRSPKDLVKYLHYLDKNDTAYREYHAWRYQSINWSIPYEDIIPNHWSTLCRLCKKVIEKPLRHKAIPSITDWLYKTRYADDLCFK